ncbi:F-actin-monooxygenase mical2b isoform X2 [Trichomycterus rosablanca]|uniref:F-actin-monooxygenase mical2b isoform X2 n=1 Tax=Trichomycterus rosablanca TaxID=2290929 RepID=UPI002F35299B
MGEMDDEKSQAGRMFENFVQASTCKSTLQAFNIMCTYLELDPQEHSSFYSSLKSKLTCWKSKALWSKLDKRASHKEYKRGKACEGTKCLIIGGGPCGLRTAIELAFLGAKVVVIEKRDTFSRNNVLHIWPFTIHDLRGLGAKKFFGKFCAGAIDHISIQQLQLILLKIALLLGVEFHINVEFIKLLEPPEDQENEVPGWRAEIRPGDHPVADFDFDVVVGADGRRNTLEGFRRKEFRGKLAIAITANFVNRNTTAEAKVEEISGVAFIFNQKFFQDLKEATSIDLENIVYYKDNTHYFVMTAKKQSLLDKGVIIHDYIDTEALLSSQNVNQEALLSYAREAADYATHYQLPTLDYANNHLEQPDVAMFDFTCMYASENAALVRERFGHQLLVTLVGDSLLEPFWPMGTGCARGFLAAFDTAWMIKSWAQGREPLEVLAERESLYRLLPQTTPENIAKNFDQYTIDPGTRYPNLNSNCVRPHQVKNYYISGELKSCPLQRAATIRRPVNLARRESEIRPSRLLTWCQKQTEGYKGVNVTDLNSSWSSGLAFCALIHRFRPHLIDYDLLNEEDTAKNAQLAFDTAEKELGIKPFTTGKELASGQELEKNSMVTYLSKFYELFRGTPLPPSDSRREKYENEEWSSTLSQPVLRTQSFTQPRKRIPKDDKKVEDKESFYKRRRTVCSFLEEATKLHQNSSLVSELREVKENKVKSMASQLLAKFEGRTPSCTLRRQFQTSASLTQVESGTALLQVLPINSPLHNHRNSSQSTHKHTQSYVNSPSHVQHTRTHAYETAHMQPNETDTRSHTCKTSHMQPTGTQTRLQTYETSHLQLTGTSTQLSSSKILHLQPTETDTRSHTLKTSHMQPTGTQTQLQTYDISHMQPTGTDTRSHTSKTLHVQPTETDTRSHTSKTLHVQPTETHIQLHRGPRSGNTEVERPASCHSALVAMKAMLQRLQKVEEQISQRKAETENAREFHKKSIKDKAVHMNSLLSGGCISLPQGSFRRELPQSLGDVCYSCKKRVYVVERLSAEGLFFHRECFRCNTCSAPLSQGGHAFDIEQGKLYCKLHFSQRKCVVKQRPLETYKPSDGEVNATTSLARSPADTHAESPVPSPAVSDTSPRQSAVFLDLPAVCTPDAL